MSTSSAEAAMPAAWQRDQPGWLQGLQSRIQRWEALVGRSGVIGVAALAAVLLSNLTTFGLIVPLKGLQVYLEIWEYYVLSTVVPLVVAPLVVTPILVILEDNRRIGERYRYLAEHDLLTGVLNRQGLFRGSRPPQAGELAVVADLNEFKQVNDTFGHAVGDELLKAVARALRLRFGEQARIGRTGGDEFIVLTDGGTPQGPGQLAVPVSRGLVGRVSLGYALLERQGHVGLEAAIAVADERMYEAKRREAEQRGRPEPRHPPIAVRGAGRGGPSSAVAEVARGG